nr:hypothetical protein [Tanacetum cinerariifolium]
MEEQLNTQEKEGRSTQHKRKEIHEKAGTSYSVEGRDGW